MKYIYYFTILLITVLLLLLSKIFINQYAMSETYNNSIKFKKSINLTISQKNNTCADRFVSEMRGAFSREFSNIHYHNSICYCKDNKTWVTDMKPSLSGESWTGVRYTPYYSSRDYPGMGLAGNNMSGYGSHFKPTTISNFDEKFKNSILVKGWSMLLFVWIDHFGHVLMDQLFPLFQSIQTFGGDVNNSNIFLVSDIKKSKLEFSFKLSKLLASTELFVDLIESVEENVICFEDFVVGLRQQSINPCCNVDLVPHGYSLFRDAVFSHNSITPHLTKQIIICIRRKNRIIKNIDDVVTHARLLFGPQWVIRVQIMENLSVLNQILLMSKTSLLITVASTESHFAIFLPTNAVSVVVLHPHHDDVNKYVCLYTPQVHCLTVTSKAISSSSGLVNSKSNVLASIPEFQNISKIAFHMLS